MHKTDEKQEMISGTTVYGFKMQWTPEHAQWAEQHFDITASAHSHMHKAEAFVGHLQHSYHYAWANDDISALTASNLLKKYAEKYSGILESPDERMLLGPYSDATGLLNGRKCESEPWQDGIYPASCVPDGMCVSKAGVTAALPPADISASIGSSPGLAGSLTETSYSSSSCGSHTVGGLHSALSSQEYPTAYSGSFLHSSYGGQSAPALSSPHPSPLHGSGLLQPPPPPPPPQTLVPTYNAGSSGISSYSYSPSDYPPQAAVTTAYSPGGAPPPSAYLPSGIAAPTPLPSSTLPGYSYESHTLAPVTPTPLSVSSSGSMKRKAFCMTGQGEINPPYGNFSYSQQCSPGSPIYSMPDSGIPNTVGGSSFDRSAETSSLAFKPSKQPVSSDQQRKFSSQSSRAPTPPPYLSSRGSKLSEPFSRFASPGSSEHGDEHVHLSHPIPGPGAGSRIGSATSSAQSAREQLKEVDSHLVDLVTSEIVQQDPPMDWSDIVGLEVVKAVIKEEIMWPFLRSDVFCDLSTIPRSVLLFGPQGTGRTSLARCIASQLRATFLKLSGSALVTKWCSDGEKIIHAAFLVARCRQPSVVFLSDVDLLLSSQLGDDSPLDGTKGELLAQLDSILASSEDHVVVVCSTSKPEEIDDSLRRYFMKRLLIPLPDSTARQQIISRVLSQHNYSLVDKEVALLVQRTDGFSGLDVKRLVQEVAMAALHAVGGGLSAVLPGHLRPVTYQDFENVLCKIQPSKSQKELDTYTEWNRMFGCGQ
ncbi:fidgetin-like isoform X2 [Brienomyrus brachyistius]|uniref:fidgetin-like isoform X2 n=2 Tax=Brienomyrus brachyistius TaxID=42636 RepID=UPI0020B3650B|nr:fidgetin-like isoform X2 [Brienomyrus brachyistius]